MTCLQYAFRPRKRKPMAGLFRIEPAMTLFPFAAGETPQLLTVSLSPGMFDALLDLCDDRPERLGHLVVQALDLIIAAELERNAQ